MKKTLTFSLLTAPLQKQLSLHNVDLGVEELLSLTKVISQTDTEFSSVYARNRALAKRVKNWGKEQNLTQPPFTFHQLTGILNSIDPSTEWNLPTNSIDISS